jgi:cytochrome c oxidase subunit 5a
MFSRLAKQTIRPLVASSQVQVRNFSVPLGGGLSHDQRVTAWVDYFDHPECDMFYFRRGNDRVIGDDWIPPPEVWQSMLYSCRRNNCLPSAIRVVEQIKNRCKDNREAFFWIHQELAPTLKDLGIKTPEELGFYDGDDEYYSPTWQDY